ncbi:urea ABC transporter permease subunit UrtB [Vibrio sp. AK197]
MILTTCFRSVPGLTRCRLIAYLIGLMAMLYGSFVLANSDDFEQGLQALQGSNFNQIGQGIDLIAQSGDERAVEVLSLLLDGDLYRHKKAHSLVVVQQKQGREYVIAPLFSQDTHSTEIVKSRVIKKIGINNRLRGQLKSLIAALNISHPDAQRRLQAVNQLMGAMDEQSYGLLKAHLVNETNASVSELGEMALAIYDLRNSGQQSIVKSAITTLKASYQPSARNALNRYLNQHPDSELAGDVTSALASIEQREKIADMTQTLFFGLSLGSVLVLAAIGLAITFGVMGVINMAHGELIMLGAYTTYVVQTLMPNHIGLSIFVSIPLAFLVSALVGILIERCVIRFLYGRPLETLLATFGISLVLQQAVRTIFSPLNRSVSTPEWMQGVIEINPMLSLTLNRLYIIAFCLIVFTLLFLILRYTRLGIEVRAVSQNRSMARAMGVRSEWVDAMTFGLGSGIAGIAGVALSQLTNVGPNLGQQYIIDSFMVVVFGGVGNLWGTLVAGMSLGVANKVLEPWAGAVLAKILVLVFIILFIQKKPRGLFPQKGRSAEG